MKFDAYSDPGHGWVKVPIKLLGKLGIEKDITSYSYRRGDYAYLEEDCDYTRFHKEMDKVGLKVEIRFHSSEKSSKIRSYRSYSP